ncbi:MAG: tRNA (adenosine(37)-N6)-threonylcarbamoyltransferase complex ATPase subunit type 1 TsaE [Gammaproteobacteria bacterium]|nr:tRNA (adenosine(37)-N6)-threonylcarbamoyltransferase complex ATPase subunit type 1 TsaE [Gammaproteobacteria bacterium]
MSQQISIELIDEQSTQHLGELIAKYLQAPLICYLQGDLGVGKTRIVRAIIQSFGYAGNVKSPTYTLVEPYQLKTVSAYHFDLYRLSDPEELDYLGIRDYFDQQSICFIEWPDKGKGWLADADISIHLEYFGEGRRCLITAHTTVGILLFTKLKQNL